MNQPEKKVVASVSEYIAYLDSLATQYSGYRFIFRGQANSEWALVPAVQRQLWREVQRLTNSTERGQVFDF
jgi:hypothetical protein